MTMARSRQTKFYDDILSKEEQRKMLKRQTCEHTGDKIIICRCCGEHLEETVVQIKMKRKTIFSKKIGGVAKVDKLFNM
jgi:hypothetical protein